MQGFWLLRAGLKEKSLKGRKDRKESGILRKAPLVVPAPEVAAAPSRASAVLFALAQAGNWTALLAILRDAAKKASYKSIRDGEGPPC